MLKEGPCGDKKEDPKLGAQGNDRPTGAEITCWKVVPVLTSLATPQKGNFIAGL